ncbi:MAG: aminoacyl-tRNA hydrolase [Fibrobacteraceae bacterium]|nr:aminoacyl-tRNA hydrolase [Fibrobacteraceae bacterium]
MYLIAGLGNPGEQYTNTRHNLGFMAVDILADSSLPWKSEHKALTQKRSLKGEDVVLAKPQTFMNLSGEAIQALMTWYKVKPENLIVLVDDITLSCGRIRVRGSGSHGGQNGLRNIIEKIGPNFVRVRIGEGICPPKWDLANWVLSKITPEDRPGIELALKNIPSVVETLMDQGIEACMGKFNGPLK